MSEGENEVHESSGSVWRDLNLPGPKYSVEAHGRGYAIYFGRSASRHGFNLAHLSDIAANGRDLPKLIEDGLNSAGTIAALTLQLEAERERAVTAEAEIERLQDRLEMRHAYDGDGNRIEVEPGSIPDGIECRDATIAALEETIARLKAEVGHE